MANVFYVAVNRFKNDKEQLLYTVVNSRYARSEITEQKLKMLYEIGDIQGGSCNDY